MVERGNIATRDLLDFFDTLLVERCRRPRDDLLTLLAADPATGEAQADLLANCVFFLLAGYMTTTALLVAGVDALLQHPDQLARLHRQSGLWPVAVEEMLRYGSPTTLTGATANVDAVVDGCPVLAGAQRTVVYAAANRMRLSSTIPTSSMSPGSLTHISHLCWRALLPRGTAGQAACRDCATGTVHPTRRPSRDEAS